MVSIIMPTYNRAYIISRSIESVLNQLYTNFELLIIDDGSTDNTEQVINSYCDERIRYIKQPTNSGACYARNIGIKNSKGEYIAFLDSDNIWDEDYLEKRIRLFEKSASDVGLVWGPIYLKRENEAEYIFPTQWKTLDKIDKDILVEKMIYDNYVDTNSAVIKAECIENAGLFCEKLKRLQDWEFFFRIVAFSGYNIKFDSEILVHNYVGSDSIGKNEEAYWTSRFYFIEKYRDLIQSYTDMRSVVEYLIYKKSPKAQERHIQRLLEYVETDCIAKTMDSLREKYEEMVRLHVKERGIISFQKRWIDSLVLGENIIVDNLKAKGIKSVAIYGFGWIGKSLFEYLRDKIEIKSILDNKLQGEQYESISIIAPKNFEDNTDVVIVTVLDEIEFIKNLYQKEVEYISIDELLEK